MSDDDVMLVITVTVTRGGTVHTDGEYTLEVAKPAYALLAIGALQEAQRAISTTTRGFIPQDAP